MGIISSSKTINQTEIACYGTLQVQLALTSAPDIVTNPTDIVLALDRSGSMSGVALDSLKAAVDQFIDMIAKATDGGPNTIGSGSRISIVSFADSATDDTGLSTSVADLKATVNALIAEGQTNHCEAFATSMYVLGTPPENKKVMVIFTDGQTSTGPDPIAAATAAKDAGITIYAIGLAGSEGVDEDVLNRWVSPPAAAHVAIAPTPEDIKQLFADLAANITKAGATNIEIHDIVNDDFIITSVGQPTVGTAVKVSDTEVRWNMDRLGVSDTESATLEFTVQHLGDTSGIKNVNASITYHDTEGNEAFMEPSPTVTTDCGNPYVIEPCAPAVTVPVEGCGDMIEYNLGDLPLESVGRIMQLDVNLKNVCPNRRVALAVVLTELDDEDQSYPRGMKTVTVPAHTDEECRDILVRCIRFVLPEDLNVSTNGLCGTRNIQAQVFAHYIDHEFTCCGMLEA